MKFTKVDLITLSALVCWYSLHSEALSVTERVQNATSQGCSIPNGNVKFTQTECGETGGCEDAERASHGSVFSVTCLGNRTFAKINEKDVQMKCVNGEWTRSLDEYKCIDLCPKMEYKSLDLQCYHSRNRVPCNQTLAPGTLVYASCKKNYEVNTFINFKNRTTCQKYGFYQYELTECTPVCGKTATSNAQTLISNGTRVNYPKYPWHIALYWKHNKYNGTFDYEYKCGGTLIDSNKVLTAAHCIWDPISGKLIEAKMLEVASGKIYSRWDALEASAQKVGVADVIPASSFKGFTTRYEQDIAVLILSENLELSDFTMPACLDLDLSAGDVPVGQRGHVVGWGREDEKDTSPSEYLMETWMEYLNVDSCHKKFRKHSFQEYLLSDKFCVLYVNGSGTQQGDSGGGLTFLHDGLHYVYGVVSIKKLGQNEFAAVTNVTSHRHWLQDILATNGLGRGCSIPQGGEIFHLMKCGDSRGCKKDWAPLNSAYSVTCAEGYGFSTPNQTSAPIFCYKGEWIPNGWGCNVFCPGLVEHRSLNLRCTYRGISVPCNQPLVADTMVAVRCKSRYKIPQVAKSNFVSKTRCKSDGTLQQELKICVPACGRPSYVNSLVSGGEDVKNTNHPWHVLVYWRKQHSTKDENPQIKNEYEYKCGGTLVDTNKVLTAAHCVWDLAKQKALSTEILAVASGKSHPMWDIQDVTEQRINVSKVMPHFHYSGVSTNYSQDIAVLILSKDLELTQHTMPICLDLDLSVGGIPRRELGQIAIRNQQVDEDFGSYTTLRDIRVEYLDLKSCRDRIKDNGFKSFLVFDKFCIFYDKGDGPLIFDFGSGVIFNRYGLQYVYGVVSLMKTGFGVATNVTSHRSWLMDIMTTN